MGRPLALVAAVSALQFIPCSSSDASSSPLHRNYAETPTLQFLKSAAGSGQHVGVCRFRVFSQNILAGSWINPNGKSAEELSDLMWNTRLDQLMQEVEHRAPDIITLQEVEEGAFYNDLRPRAIARGFDGVFSTKSGQPIGVAVFWKVSSFDAETAMHADLTDSSQSRWYVQIAFGFSAEQMNRYLHTARRTTLFVMLRSRKEFCHGAQLIIGTTHLIATVHARPTNLDVQAFQAIRMMEALEVIASRGTTPHIVLTGDFNAPPFYPAAVVSELERLIQDTADKPDKEEKVLRDRNANCQGWAKSGECLSNSGYMLEECALACLNAGVAPDERRRLLCEYKLSNGYCKDAADGMRVHCPAVCPDVKGPAPAEYAGAIVRSPVYELVTAGRLSADSVALLAMAAKSCDLAPSQVLPMEMLTADFKAQALRSAYAEALGSEPATCLDETLDYIFFRSNPGQTRLDLLGVLEPPRRLAYEDTIREVGSDHVPLVADFSVLLSIS